MNKNSAIEEKLDILKRVSELLPPKTAVEKSVITRLQREMRKLIDVPTASILQENPTADIEATFLREVQTLADDISEMFNQVDDQELFSAFPITVEKRAVGHFIRNEGHEKKDGKYKTGVDGRNVSIRLFVAYLACNDRSSFSIEDIEFKKLNNRIARDLNQFIGHNDSDPENLTVKQLESIYGFEFDVDGTSTKRQLIFDVSEDETHFIVEERLWSKSDVLKEGQSNSKAWHGWSVISRNNMLLIFLEDVDDANGHQYINLFLETSDSNIPITESLVLTKLKFPFDDEVYEANPIESDQIKTRIEKSTDVFRKYGELLTFPQPSDDIHRKRKASKLPYMSGSRSSVNAVQEDGKGYVMDDEEKEKLGKELIKAATDYDHFSFNRIFELLDAGASINYRDRRTGATAMHFLSRGASLSYYSDIVRRSHEEFNHLMRDNRGKLCSDWALNQDNEEVYKVLLNNEVEAGRAKDLVPYPGGDFPIEDEKPHDPEI